MLEEEIYANKAIIPLLQTMGFVDVCNTHGIYEFGKDILFSEFNKFGIKKYYAAQVKSIDIRGKNRGNMEDIIGHITRAFSVSFSDLISKEQVYIDEFYIITSKSFLDSAREIITRDKRIKDYGNRLHFFDGNKINELWQYNVVHIEGKIKSLIRELYFNERYFGLLTEELKTKGETATPPLIRFKTSVIEFILFEESIEKYINFQNLQVLLHILNMMNSSFFRIQIYGWKDSIDFINKCLNGGEKLQDIIKQEAIQALSQIQAR